MVEECLNFVVTWHPQSFEQKCQGRRAIFKAIYRVPGINITGLRIEERQASPTTVIYRQDKKPVKEEEEDDDAVGDVSWDDLDMGLCDLFNPATQDEAPDHSDHGSEDDDFWTTYTLQELDRRLLEQERQSRRNQQATATSDDALIL